MDFSACRRLGKAWHSFSANISRLKYSNLERFSIEESLKPVLAISSDSNPPLPMTCLNRAFDSLPHR